MGPAKIAKAFNQWSVESNGFFSPDGIRQPQADNYSMQAIKYSSISADSRNGPLFIAFDLLPLFQHLFPHPVDDYALS